MNPIYQWLAQVIGYTHPIHPPLTYLPMGMVIGALIFGALAKLPRQGKYAPTARHCITLAFIGVFPTILLGYMDWQHYYGGAWIFAIKMKIILAVLLTLLLLAAVWMHHAHGPGGLSILFVYLLAFANIVALGYFGGDLVFGIEPQKAAEAPAKTATAPAEGEVTFADVRPILEQYCVMCHKGEDSPRNLRLTTYAQVMAGSQGGPVVVPGQPAQSEMVKRIKGTVTPQMPLGTPPLSQEKIQVIVDWIARGAPRG